MFAIIDSLKNKLDQSRSLSDFTSRNIENDLFLRWIFHSNAISGNRLSLLETKVVLEGITVGGKKLKDHFEVINHRNAIYYVEKIIRKEESFSECQIRNIHQLILRNIDDENAGQLGYCEISKGYIDIDEWYKKYKLTEFFLIYLVIQD